MHLIAKVIRISHAKFHCNRLITVQDIQNYASLIFLGHSVHSPIVHVQCVFTLQLILHRVPAVKATVSRHTQ